ncbi:hypothetical protein [Neglectibacter timonensis]|uniref:hypothetical protein n=1 Tax=Neglectibacter timonensis TaxID=1776382 RepID=UPI0023F059ED|nr:hypothetical protein [Neglectibacter timonensis]
MIPFVYPLSLSETGRDPAVPVPNKTGTAGSFSFPVEASLFSFGGTAGLPSASKISKTAHNSGRLLTNPKKRTIMISAKLVTFPVLSSCFLEELLYEV